MAAAWAAGEAVKPMANLEMRMVRSLPSGTSFTSPSNRPPRVGQHEVDVQRPDARNRLGSETQPRPFQGEDLILDLTADGFVARHDGTDTRRQRGGHHRPPGRAAVSGANARSW